MRLAWILFAWMAVSACKTGQKAPQQNPDKSSSQVISEQKNGIDEFRLLEQKFQRDVQFFATGNEPFWSLDMNFTLFMRFRIMDSLDIQTAAGKPQTAPDGISTLYKAASETGEVIVSIMPQQCIDNMSGRTFSHEVAVRARTSPESPYAEVKGCGRFVPDFRLNNAWVLQAVDGVEIPADSLIGRMSTMEIDLRQSAVTGFGGCNQYTGSFTHDGNNIRFGEMAATKMFCPSAGVEQRFLSALNGQSYYYVVSNKGILKLMNGEHALVLRLVR